MGIITAVSFHWLITCLLICVVNILQIAADPGQDHLLRSFFFYRQTTKLWTWCRNLWYKHIMISIWSTPVQCWCFPIMHDEGWMCVYRGIKHLFWCKLCRIPYFSGCYLMHICFVRIFLCFFFFVSCIKQLDMRIYDAECAWRSYNTASSDDKTYL